MVDVTCLGCTVPWMLLLKGAVWINICLQHYLEVEYCPLVMNSHLTIVPIPKPPNRAKCYTRPTDRTMTKALLASLLLLLLQGAHGFYLPGVNPYSFTEGEV